MILANRVAIVTGAGSGIGRAGALDHGARGRTSSSSRTAAAAAGADTVHAIHAAGGHGKSVVTDVADDAQLEHLVQHTLRHRHRIDILHNHAGIQVEGTLEQVAPDGDGQIPGGSMSGRISCWRSWSCRT